MKRNIGTKGRAARAITGVLLLLIAVWLLPLNLSLGLLPLAFGFFALFEALRGWCALRACGIRTPL